MNAVKARFAGKRTDVDMTEGSIVRHLISFAFPLLIGNIFQQFYNTVDTWVVGNYVSNEAFSAVGTVGPIVNMLIGFFTGLAGGAGAVISQYYGGKKYDNVEKAVHTSLILTLVMGVLFTALGIWMTPFMLRMMKTPAEVFPESRTYLLIYFAGILGLMIYNMGAGILRAIGDSRRPFYFLVVSTLLNIFLDLLFVLQFKMGVAGVAYATILSQGVSAILVLIVLMTSKTCVRVHVSRLRVDWKILGKILLVGFPTAIQTAITAFSNVFVQSYINYFGPDCMSGWTAYSKIDQIILLPMQSVAIAVTTFVAQNLGNRNQKRAKRGMKIALLIALIGTLCLMIPVMIFAPGLVGFFNRKEEVVTFGSMFLRTISPFYLLCCINQIHAGALRGAGDSRAPMFIMLGCFVGFRQLYLYVMTNFITNEILPVALGYPAGWIVCSASLMIYYRIVGFSKNRIIES